MNEMLAPREPARAARPSTKTTTNIVLLESLIERLRACERVFDLTHVAHNGAETEDIVFIDDLSDILASNMSINELCADSASMALAARYSATLKAALHILLQIRQLHNDMAAYHADFTRR